MIRIIGGKLLRCPQKELVKKYLWRGNMPIQRYYIHLVIISALVLNSISLIASSNTPSNKKDNSIYQENYYLNEELFLDYGNNIDQIGFEIGKASEFPTGENWEGLCEIFGRKI
jgi:hypothetical protein